jgi:O-antigen/teichoic acid export membrane protein
VTTPFPDAAAPAPEAAPPPSAGSLARATLYITAARSLQWAAILVVGVLQTRRLTRSEVGTFQHLPFLAAVIPMAIAVPLGKAVTYFLPRTRSPDRVLRRIAVTLVACGLAAGLTIGFLPQVLRLFDRGDDQLVGLHWIVAATVACAFPYAICEYVLLARGMRRAVVLLLAVQGAWMVTGIGGALLLAPPETRLRWALTALLVAHAIPAGVTLVWLFRPLRADPADPGPQRKELLRYIGPLVAATFVNLVAAQLDKFLVPIIYPMDQDPVAKALYFRGAMDIPLLGAVAFTLNGLLAPELAARHAAGDTAGLLALWRKGCRMVAVATIPAAALLWACAQEAFTFVFGELYVGSVPIFRWYVVALIARCFIPQLLLESTGATTKSLAFSVVALVSAGLLTVVLVPVWGLVGFAAASITAGLVANWLFGGAFARHSLGVRWSELLDWDHMVRLVLVSVGAVQGAVAIGLLDAFYAPPLFVRGVLRGVVFAVLFVGLARLLRSPSREDLEMLRGLLKRRPKAA